MNAPYNNSYDDLCCKASSSAISSNLASNLDLIAANATDDDRTSLCQSKSPT